MFALRKGQTCITMTETHLAFSLEEGESFGDGKELVLIYNRMPLVSIMATKAHEERSTVWPRH